MHQLVYEPDQAMQNMLNRFIQEYVFFEEEDGKQTFKYNSNKHIVCKQKNHNKIYFVDEHDEHSKIEELHKRRNFLASYCKLIVYNMIPTKAAADVFKHYVKYYNDYGDIIKTTLGKARDINKTNCALTMQQSLNILYNEIVAEKGKVNRNSEEFTAIKVCGSRYIILKYNGRKYVKISSKLLLSLGTRKAICFVLRFGRRKKSRSNHSPTSCWRFIRHYSTRRHWTGSYRPTTEFAVPRNIIGIHE